MHSRSLVLAVVSASALVAGVLVLTVMLREPPPAAGGSAVVAPPPVHRASASLPPPPEPTPAVLPASPQKAAQDPAPSGAATLHRGPDGRFYTQAAPVPEGDFRPSPLAERQVSMSEAGSAVVSGAEMSPVQAQPGPLMLVQGRSVVLAARAAPGASVTFAVFDGGFFLANRDAQCTVIAGSDGVAVVGYHAPAGTIEGVRIRAVSPQASGEATWYVVVREDPVARQ